MATIASTVSPTSGQIKYVDVGGIEHTVSDSETFVLTIDDTSSTDVRYSWAVNATGVTLTDGRRLEFRPRVGFAGNNDRYTVGKLADAQDGVQVYNPGGGFIMECPESHARQNWHVTKIKASNVDFNASGTLLITMEDQFGHVMNWPFQLVSTLAVAQAA